MGARLVLDAVKVKELYDSGLSLTAVGRQFNCSGPTIAARLREAGYLIINKGETGWKNIPEDKIKQLYQSGLSMMKIADIFNCSFCVIQKRMKEMEGIKEMGVTIKNPGPYLGDKIEINKDELKRLYVDEQLTVREVASTLHSSKATVQKRLKKYGWLRNLSDAFAISKIKGRRKRSCEKLGRLIEGRGYVLVQSPNHHRADHAGYVYEHVLVWEEYYHKKLPKGYIIHHLNGNKGDNRPENLVAMTRGAHASLAEPYKKRIRQLEIENRQLRRALEYSQMIMYLNEN